MNNTFVQPFVSYTLPSAWTFSIQSETTYTVYREFNDSFVDIGHVNEHIISPNSVLIPIRLMPSVI